MSRTGAFHNEASVKASAMQDAATGTHRGWATDATEVERADCAETFGLSNGLVTLLSMSSRAPYLEGSCDFLRDTLAHIEPGADTDAILRHWFTVVWSDSVHGVALYLPEGEVKEAAQAIVRMVEKSGHTAIARPEWRAARSALLAAITVTTPEAAAYARVVTAMAWDMSAMSGVAADVWLAWERANEEKIGLAAGWPKSLQDEVTEHYRASLREAQQQVPPIAEDATAQERQAREIALKNAADAALEQSGHRAQWDALMAYWQSGVVDHFMAWREHALDTIKSAAYEGSQSTT